MIEIILIISVFLLSCLVFDLELLSLLLVVLVGGFYRTLRRDNKEIESIPNKLCL